MKIEDAIQLSAFKIPAEKAVINLMHTAHCVHERTEIFFRNHNVTPQQYNILRILRGQKGKGICQSDIRDRMVERSPDVSRILDRLVAAGWAVRRPDEANRRKVEVYITDEGLRLLSDVDAELPQHYAPYQHLSEEWLEDLSKRLDELRCTIQQADANQLAEATP